MYVCVCASVTGGTGSGWCQTATSAAGRSPPTWTRLRIWTSSTMMQASSAARCASFMQEQPNPVQNPCNVASAGLCFMRMATLPRDNTDSFFSSNPFLFFNSIDPVSHMHFYTSPMRSEVFMQQSPHAICVLCSQFCTCPAGYQVSCPDDGTAPGCALLPTVSKGWSALGVVTAILVVSVASILCKRQLTADLCRLCLGAGNPLGEAQSTHRLFPACCTLPYCSPAEEEVL